MPVSSTPSDVHLLVGGYTGEMDGSAVGVSSCQLTFGAAGQPEVVELGAAALTSPSYLVRHPGQPWVFAVSEGRPGELTSLRVHPDGTLTVISSVTLTADGPCHLAVAPGGGLVVVANYLSGSVSSSAVASDGSLSPTVSQLQFAGSGPVPTRQEGPHAHQVVWDGDELLVCDLGTDRVHRLRLGGQGQLSSAAPPLQLPPGSGPRHLVLLEDHLVVACELSAELWLARRTESGWEPVQTVPSSTAEVDAPVFPSAIVADDGRVFVANRGAGTVGVFDLDPVVGRLEPVGEFACGGDWPRDLVLTPGRLWVANQTDDRVDVFSTETIPPPGPAFTFDSPSPACLLPWEPLRSVSTKR